MTNEFTPSWFVGHGGPMNALRSNAYTDAWVKFGESVPNPRAVLAISAHWFVNASVVTAMAEPKTIHDFYGPPSELFEIQYPAPGDPEFAQEIIDVVYPTWIGKDFDSWGFDHGTWSVLCRAYPKAIAPVVQLSVDASKPLGYHFELGRRLAPLRERGVLIMASGNVVHNLPAVDRSMDVGGFDWANRFDDDVFEIMTSAPHRVLELEEHPDFLLAVPTPEHFLPLVYLAGLASEANAKCELLVKGMTRGSLSMASYVLH